MGHRKGVFREETRVCQAMDWECECQPLLSVSESCSRVEDRESKGDKRWKWSAQQKSTELGFQNRCRICTQVTTFLCESYMETGSRKECRLLFLSLGLFLRGCRIASKSCSGSESCLTISSKEGRPSVQSIVSQSRATDTKQWS